MEAVAKYYTPALEDIRVGYEGEYHNVSMDLFGVSEHNWDRWDKAVLTKVNVEIMMKHGIKNFRVPYLTREQIEAEGWQYNETYNVYHHPTKEGYCVNQGSDYRMSIAYYGTPVFNGTIPSINEFRTICKLLCI